MNLTESLLTALDSLSANKLRAVLTMLGVIIGVAAVIALMAIGNGFSDFVTQEINAIGTNLIFVVTDFENSDGYPALSLDDVNALNDPSRVPAVAAVAAVTQGTQEVVSRGNSHRGTVAGVTANYFQLNNLIAVAGDLFVATDVDARASVAVLGWDVADNLFGDDLAVRQSVQINGVTYRVVGVLNRTEGAIGVNPNDNVYVPLTTAQTRLYTQRTRRGAPAVNSITAQSISPEQAENALAQMATVLREEHTITYASSDDFILTSQQDLLATFDNITGTLTLFLGAIAGISLLVGGIGIMNIMLVSVTERTREIGIRKAVGALRRDILAQFLIESLILSLIGGLIGIALGWLLSVAGGNAVDVSPVVDVQTVLIAVLFSMGVGLVFGIYPAWRASNLRPIEALRYE